VVYLRVRLSVCVLVTAVSPAETVASMVMLLGAGSRVPSETTIRGDAHRRHLANTTEQSVLTDDTASCHHYCGNRSKFLSVSKFVILRYYHTLKVSLHFVKYDTKSNQFPPFDATLH